MVSVLDSRVFRNLFGTSEMRRIFDDETYVARMIEVETALARAQSKVGVIDSQAGETVTKAAAWVKIDYDKLSIDTEIVGYPVMPLVHQMVAQMPDGVARFVHWGATTQDIMDNASQLQMRDGLKVVRTRLEELVAVLQKLATKYRDTPMAGRTHLQHALPCTFGYKCAVYLSSITRHLERLGEIEKRCLLVQFGGASGTLASLGESFTVAAPANGSNGTVKMTTSRGLEVRAALATELGLQDPPITWHAVRDNIAEILNFLALVGASLGKIAYDLIIMASNEVSEVSEPFLLHRGASSTMPQKRNPISSEIIFSAAKLLRADAALGLDAVVVDFERATGPWHLEWAAIPSSFVVAAGALHQTLFALRGLVVHDEEMESNLNRTRGLIVSEAVMMALAPHVGRHKAHTIVYDACKTAIEKDKPLLEVLHQQPEVIQHFKGPEGEAALADACDVHNYLGASQAMVDQMVRVADAAVPHKNGTKP